MTHAQDVIRESEKVPTLNARMGTGGNQVPILTENIPESVIMGHDERSARFHTETTDPLTACDYKQPPIVAQMSTTGQSAYAIGNGQADQLQMSAKVGALNCMHDQIAVMQKTCNGKQTVGSLCAHDGRGFNGQDVANDKLIVETMNESI